VNLKVIYAENCKNLQTYEEKKSLLKKEQCILSLCISTKVLTVVRKPKARSVTECRHRCLDLLFKGKFCIHRFEVCGF